jgi:hypothetical protein
MALSQYKILGEAIGAQALSDTASVQQFPIGFEVEAVKIASASNDTGGFARFVYAQGSNVASVGQFVHLQNGSAQILAAANSASKFPVGVACAVLGATSQYGWVQRDGYCDYARGTNSSIAAGVPLYVAAGTAGYLVTNVVVGNMVLGVVAPASYTSSQSQSLTVHLDNPKIVGISGAI